jgi:hypothetical protein
MNVPFATEHFFIAAVIIALLAIAVVVFVLHLHFTLETLFYKWPKRRLIPCWILLAASVYVGMCFDRETGLAVYALSAPAQAFLLYFHRRAMKKITQHS